MKFGKLPSVEGVDFSLPPLHQPSVDKLGGKPHPGFAAFVGLSRWASKDWVGNLFPAGTKPAAYLQQYARTFNTIELNSTHYRTPSPDQVRAWEEQVPAGFRFCPKIPQQISHFRKLVGIEQELAQFVHSISHFGEKLGCSFVQLHESFSPRLFAQLRDFLLRWPMELPLAVEFRHADWFLYQALIPEALDLLQGLGKGIVITDVAGRRDVLHTCLGGQLSMIRLVGNELIPSDFERSDAWLASISEWKAHGLRDLYVFPHEPEDRMASELGQYWLSALRERDWAVPGTQAAGPARGDQLSLF